MRHGAIELDWADGTFTFRLGLREIEELEEKCDAGVFTLARTLNPVVPTARLKHVAEVLRIGLIGGGMLPVEALAKVRRYCEERPLTESLLTAYAVVMSAIARVNSADLPKDDAPGEPMAAEKEPTSPQSTQPVS